MEVIKLDKRHRFYREYNMRHAIVFRPTNRWPNYGPYEAWLAERYGQKWYYNEWYSGWPNGANLKHNYYIAVKDPSILTMMALALGDTYD